MFAYLPLAFARSQKMSCLFATGCGVTRTRYSWLHVKRNDVVDISKEVFALAILFRNQLLEPLRDPRVHAIVQDGGFSCKPVRDKSTLFPENLHRQRSWFGESLH